MKLNKSIGFGRLNYGRKRYPPRRQNTVGVSLLNTGINCYSVVKTINTAIIL
jgi:hypothetical protein